MAQDRKDNTGALFKAKAKLTDRHPDMTGQATIGGVEYWVSAWKKVGGGKPLYFLILHSQGQDGEAEASAQGR